MWIPAGEDRWMGMETHPIYASACMLSNSFQDVDGFSFLTFFVSSLLPYGIPLLFDY
jgi:hypothetical protein